VRDSFYNDFWCLFVAEQGAGSQALKDRLAHIEDIAPIVRFANGGYGTR